MRRAQLIDGIDPVQEKQQKRLEAELAAKTTFKLVADEYIQKMEREGKAPATRNRAGFSNCWTVSLAGRSHR